ncbi:hypothetical protein SAMN05428642_1185 [Flaviramulus basaltis]|uniref:Uncharacterized protein n=1 Tax=Flaviramulus basaltis TaxID=369401 RepID=A0A1K2IU22_9FLAO|nr:hypothetical protein [Flaviramulus basaltis]SFZ95235.1 hypothetical protein SAMN05428642_1185 [Flaviramulus basaltis]
MNDHLIKNLKISLFWSLLGNFIIGGLIIYFINSLKPIEWYAWLIYLIYPTYLMIKEKKILLGIEINGNEISIKSYSIFGGKKELNLNINEIIELDFFRGFVVKYKNSLGKNTETFQINAEPWNNVYGQIKNLKLAIQELRPEKSKKLNLKTAD